MQHSSLLFPIVILEENGILWIRSPGPPKTGWPDDLENIRPILWKVAKTVAKTQNMILNSLFQWKYNKFVAQGIAILGLLLQWAYKSSLIG